MNTNKADTPAPDEDLPCFYEKNHPQYKMVKSPNVFAEEYDGYARQEPRRKPIGIIIYNGMHISSILPLTRALHVSGVACEFLSMGELSVTTHEGITLYADSYFLQDQTEYDALILPNAERIFSLAKNRSLLRYVRLFKGRVIGAIGRAPVLYAAAEICKNLRYTGDISPEELMQRGFPQWTYDGLSDAESVVFDCINDDGIISARENYADKFARTILAELGIALLPDSPEDEEEIY